jgi:hypothetical protein
MTKPNPLTGNVSYKTLMARLAAGAPITTHASPVPNWSHIYIGTQVAVGCRTTDSQKYLTQLIDLQTPNALPSS